MTAQSTHAPFPVTPGRRLGLLTLAGLAVLVGIGLAARMLDLPIRPHAPDLALLGRQSWVIQIHIAAALSALSIGVILLIGVKGTTAHRTLGWLWVLAMATTALSSLFIRQINPGGFSFVHLLSGWTVIVLPMAVYAAKRHRVDQHRKNMTGIFVGGLLIAGALSFLPGRLMWHVFF